MKSYIRGLALAAVLAPLWALADGNVTGRVLSQSTGEPLDYATVALERDGKLVRGLVTDEEGHFTLGRVPDGAYTLKVSYVGTVAQELPVAVRGANVDVGTISLADDAQLLQEVTVTGVKGQMRFELDRKVFNVDSNIAAAGLSASELLESIPSVEVDQDGEVSLRGNTSVTVWINGKESGLTSDNRAQILEQIPAETIERVEVITNPSAKYSPEGTAGIINIVLKKSRAAGYYGSAELGANTRGGANANFNINVSSGRWDTYAGLGLRMRHNHGGSRQRRSYTGASEGLYLDSDGDSHNHGDNIFLRLGTTWHPGADDDISLSGFGMLGHRWGRSVVDYRSNLPGQWTSNTNTTHNSGDMRGAHGELSWTHRFAPSSSLEALLGYNHWGGPSLNSYLQQQRWPDAEAEADTDIYQEQAMNIVSNSVEAKLDYTGQLAKWLKLEAGYNGNYSHENTPTSTLAGTAPSDAVADPALFNRFIYTNNITALYATLGGKTGRFSFSAGLRGEAWQVRTRSLGYGEAPGDVPLYRSNNFALFPSAFISYSLPADNELQINYTRRIRRPWGGQLNSFVNISNPTNISFGNPELAPQYSNSLELNYLKTWTYHMISVSAYLRQSSSVTNRISYLDGDVLYTTWANAGTQQNTGAEIVAKNQLFRVLDLTTTLNLYNSHYRAWSLAFERDGHTFDVGSAARNSFAWDVRCMASVRLPWQLSIQATGRYNSRQITAQGSREPGWDVDLGLRKNLGSWSFSINCRDLFDSRKWHNVTRGDGYVQDNEQWRGGRRVQFTIKYSFGNMSQRQRPDSMEGSGQGSSSDSEPDNSGYSAD